MTVYKIVHITIFAHETCQEYEAGFMDIFTQCSGKVLSVDVTPEPIEGI